MIATRCRSAPQLMMRRFILHACRLDACAVRHQADCGQCLAPLPDRQGISTLNRARLYWSSRWLGADAGSVCDGPVRRSEEHTSELPSLMRISYAVFCMTNKT